MSKVQGGCRVRVVIRLTVLDTAVYTTVVPPSTRPSSSVHTLFRVAIFCCEGVPHRWGDAQLFPLPSWTSALPILFPTSTRPPSPSTTWRSMTREKGRSGPSAARRKGKTTRSKKNNVGSVSGPSSPPPSGRSARAATWLVLVPPHTFGLSSWGLRSFVC